MSEKRIAFADRVPDHAVCFWQQDGAWVCAHRDYKPGDPFGRGPDFEVALRALQVNKLHNDEGTSYAEQQ